MREAEGALFNTEPTIAVDDRLIERLKMLARRSPTRRFRLCLHQTTDEPVQEMIVVHCRDNYSRPHCHDVPLTYVVLEGDLRVLCFTESGEVSGAIELGPFASGRPFVLRLEPWRWYMPVCLTPQVVFRETKAGPFDRNVTNIWAPWSPAEQDHDAIAAYRRKLGIIDLD